MTSSKSLQRNPKISLDKIIIWFILSKRFGLVWYHESDLIYLIINEVRFFHMVKSSETDICFCWILPSFSIYFFSTFEIYWLVCWSVNFFSISRQRTWNSSLIFGDINILGYIRLPRSVMCYMCRIIVWLFKGVKIVIKYLQVKRRE